MQQGKTNALIKRIKSLYAGRNRGQAESQPDNGIEFTRFLRNLLVKYERGELDVAKTQRLMRRAEHPVSDDPRTRRLSESMNRRLRKRWGAEKPQHEKESAMLRDVDLLLAKYSTGTLDCDKFAHILRLYRSAKYCEDALATIADAEWLESDSFNQAYEAGAGISVWGHKIRWRVYTLISAATIASRLPGDFVECGVDRGGTARCVIEAMGRNAFAKRRFYLFDTFHGLSPDLLTEEETKLTRITDERYPEVLDQVRATFAEFDFVRLVPGVVPESLCECDSAAVAYLHIDMNSAYPEIEALKYFWPKLVTGAAVVFDDYGFPFHAPQRRALDEVADALGTTIMMLPTGQGLLWKTP